MSNVVNSPKPDNHDKSVATQSFRELPKMHTTYANVIKSLLPSRDVSVSSEDLPKAVYEVPRLVIDERNLDEYRKICGFIKDGRVPATYFAVLSQTLQMNMMAKPDFPFAMLGLVHIYNQVTQYRSVFDTESVHLSVRLDNLRAHERGQQFDFITEVHVDDTLVWSGISTYLSRQKRPKSDRPSDSDNVAKATSALPKLNAGAEGIGRVLEASEDIGRRYAFVSGDFNLIHLHPLSARAFGFPRAIAHGMWSKARVLASLGKLPEAFCMEVAFKLPIFLPSTVDLVAVPESACWQFAVYAQTDEPKPHLTGTLSALTQAQGGV